MARFANVTGYPLPFPPLGRDISPGAEFDWPAYDPEVHGAVTGCRALDSAEAAPAPAAAPKTTPAAPAAATPAGSKE